MSGKFELYSDKSGEYRFRLKASNGQVIATSQGYKSKPAALNGIEAVIRHSQGAELIDLTEKSRE